MRGKTRLALCMTVMLCFAFAGCMGEEEKEPVTLSFMHGWGGTMKTHALMQEIYGSFDEKNEDIALSFQPSSDSSITVEKANDMLAVDKMPDIVSTNGQSYYVQNAVKRQKALNLLPYIEADEELKKQIHPSILESWVEEDAMYTLPDVLEVMGYWYNSAYLEAAGVECVPKTWEEFYAMCDALQSWQEGQSQVLGVYALEHVQTVENLFLARLAGESREGYEMAQEIPVSFDTESFRRTVGDFSRLWQYSQKTDSLDNARQYFKEGRTVLYFNGVWESEAFMDSLYAEDFAYANYPTNEGKSLSYISPSSGYVLYDSEDEAKKEAGIRFLKYMLSEEVQTRLALETGQAPSNPQVSNQVIEEQYPLLGNALIVAHDADIQIKTISSVWDSRIIGLLQKNLYAASRREEDLEKLIRDLNQFKQE